MIKKLFISLILVIAFLFSFSALAYADPIGGAGLLSGGLSAIGIDLLVGGSATAAMLAPWLNDNFSIVGALTGVADGFIKVGDSSVIIDGVEFESIYLDPNFAQTLHTKVFDFKTQHAIGPFSSGILATGYGYLDDLPLYSVNGNIVSQSQTGSLPARGATENYTIGSVDYSISTAQTQQTSAQVSVTSTYNNSSETKTAGLHRKEPDTSHPNTFSAYVSDYQNNTFRFCFLNNNGTTTTYFTFTKASDWVQNSFDYSYVSGSIDVNPLPSDYGFQVFVPVDDLEDAGFSPGTYINVGTGTDDIIQLIQLLDDIFAEDNILNPEFTDVIEPPSPTPTPVPVPTDALGNVPYPDFIDTFGQSVYNRLDNIEDTVDTVGQSITDELEYQSSIFDTIGLAIDSIESAVTDVVDGIHVKVGEIADTLVDIKDGILEAIEEGPIKLIDYGIDVLRSIFGPILQTIRSHVGIWHYVVSWVQSITTPFTWILGIANSTSYYMVLPLYALVAGTLVIAIYKRFGR